MTAGRPDWGDADEIGARNLVDGAATLRGVAAVQSGQIIPLALLIEPGKPAPAADIRPPIQHFMTRDGGDYAAGLPERFGFGFTDDVIILPTHGTTHIDALSHVLCSGEIYNGYSSDTITSKGAHRCGIEKLDPIVTRGLFVDLAPPEGTQLPHAITSEMLQAAVQSTGVVPESGDALLVRTGWLQQWREGNGTPYSTTGLHHDCADWIIEQGFVMVAADNVAVEVLPSHDPDCAVPLHIRLIQENGIYLAELFDLEELALVGQASFQFMIAPLRIKGGVGSPITPVAIL